MSSEVVENRTSEPRDELVVVVIGLAIAALSSILLLR